MSNSIKITLTKIKSNEDCFSHLFGSPIIPSSLKKTIDNLDDEVMFFGEFDLSEIALFDTENKITHEGYLYIFIDTANYPYKAKTFYSKDKPELCIDGFNDCVPDFERFTEPYAMIFEKTEEDVDGTKLFGTPSWEFDDAELFMQFDPLDNETGFLDNIDGYLFFTFGDKKRTLSNIRLTIEHS